MFAYKFQLQFFEIDSLISFNKVLINIKRVKCSKWIGNEWMNAFDSPIHVHSGNMFVQLMENFPFQGDVVIAVDERISMVCPACTPKNKRSRKM